MRRYIDQPPRARDRRMIRRHLLQSHSQKIAQRQRVRCPPGNSSLAVDPFEIPDQQQAEVPPRRQTRPPHLRRIEAGTLLFNKTRQTRAPPALGSDARRKGAPPSAVTPCARSTRALVVPASLSTHGPCAHSTDDFCGSHHPFLPESRLAPRTSMRRPVGVKKNLDRLQPHQILPFPSLPERQASTEWA